MGDRAIDQLPRDEFYWEALRIAEERDFDETSVMNIAVGLRHRAFMEAIQPLLRTLVRMEALDVRPMMMTSDGAIRRGEPSEEQRKVAGLVNDLIIDAAQRFGLSYCPLPDPHGKRSGTLPR